ncbi:MAG: macrolide ABC transporter ATP-binding protein, partial [Bacteroidota bacterium]
NTGEEIMGLFDALHSEGNTIILVTDEEEIAAHARRAIRVRDGHVERDEIITDRKQISHHGYATA